MPAGRPTKYNEEMLDKARLYIDGGYREGNEPEVIPTFEGLSLWLNITKPTLYDWGSQDDKGEFSYELDRLKSKQGLALLSGGLSGAYNATIAKLLLHGHGHSDTQKTDVTTNGKELGVINILGSIDGRSSGLPETTE